VNAWPRGTFRRNFSAGKSGANFLWNREQNFLDICIKYNPKTSKENGGGSEGHHRHQAAKKISSF
jgi:hypothetical protein